MIDDRSEEIKRRFPLRVFRLDICECGHDDSDHQTEIGMTGVKDGECSICVCKGFQVKLTND